jgi:hypothetical protein
MLMAFQTLKMIAAPVPCDRWPAELVGDQRKAPHEGGANAERLSMKGFRTGKALGRFDRLHPHPHFGALRRIPR